MSPALAGRFFTTEPPGKPQHTNILDSRRTKHTSYIYSHFQNQGAPDTDMVAFRHGYITDMPRLFEAQAPDKIRAGLKEAFFDGRN